MTVPHPKSPEPSYGEFVALIALLMALNALAIDAMLPALPAIGVSFGVRAANQLQWIVIVFLMGMGTGQLIYGPLSDWLGRKPVLLAGLSLYVVFSILAAFSTSLPELLAMRAAQGLAAAASNVLPRSIVRDRFEGRAMARVLSLAFMVFLIVPILAPSLGQTILLYLPWRGIFGVFALLGSAVATWAWFRLPETLHPEYLQRPSPSHLREAALQVLTDPVSIFYTLAMTVLLGSLFAYVSTVQQIFAVIFHLPKLMPAVFALCAGGMGVAAYSNSRIVERLGMRRISHAALLCFIAVTALHALILTARGGEPMAMFAALQALTMVCMSLATPNFGSIAMQPMGAIAGIAASLQGVITVVGGALLGSAIGQQFNGSAVFLPTGAVCCGMVALGLVLVAEKGRLFRVTQ